MNTLPEVDSLYVVDTSNTLMIGEKRLNLNQITTACHVDDNQGYSVGFDEDTLRCTYDPSGNGQPYPPLPDFVDQGVYGYTNSSDEYRFGSSHKNGFQGAFCDGSVRTIPYDIAPTTFMNLGAIGPNRPPVGSW